MCMKTVCIHTTQVPSKLGRNTLTLTDKHIAIRMSRLCTHMFARCLLFTTLVFLTCLNFGRKVGSTLCIVVPRVVLSCVCDISTCWHAGKLHALHWRRLWWRRPVVTRAKLGWWQWFGPGAALAGHFQAQISFSCHFHFVSPKLYKPKQIFIQIHVRLTFW